MNRNRLLIVAFVLMSTLVWYAAAEACPGCADAQAGQGAERGGIVQGYMLSIMFMMSVPFILVGSFGTYVFLHFRRVRLAAEAEAVAKSQAEHGAESEQRAELVGSV